VLEGVGVGYNRVDVKLTICSDTLFLCQPKFQCIMVIKAILRCFEIFSGLKVNFYKSHVGIIGVSDVDTTIFAKCFNCGRVEIPFKYLSMKIGGNPRTLAFLEANHS